MQLQVTHKTTYRYSTAVTLGHNQLRLTPRNCPRQQVLTSRLAVKPAPAIQTSWTDICGNEVTYLTVEQPHQEQVITLEAKVELADPPLPDQISRVTWNEARNELQTNSAAFAVEALPFRFNSPHALASPEALNYARPSFAENRSLFDCVRDLTRRIRRDFVYDSHATSISTTTIELLKLGRGVCQDFTHLQIACLRSLGLAARYVSGYLVTQPPPGRPKLRGADASHAWPSVFFPGFGWVDFDPTNDRLVGPDYVTLAWGRDYSDVTPIKGMYLGGGTSTLHVEVDVVQL